MSISFVDHCKSAPPLLISSGRSCLPLSSSCDELNTSPSDETALIKVYQLRHPFIEGIMATVARPPSDVTLREIKQNQATLMSRINEAVYSNSGESIPLIDIGPSLNGDESARKFVAAQIGKACREIGFFQITNHGVSQLAQAGILEQARRFFHELPLAKKKELHINNSGLFRGWEPSEFSNVNPNDWKTTSKETKEAFNWGYEPKLDPTGGDGKYVELDLASYPDGANVWPNEEDLPGFFEKIREYHGEVSSTQRRDGP